MTITKTLNADVLTLALEGRLDTMTAPELEAELKQSMDGAQAPELGRGGFRLPAEGLGLVRQIPQLGLLAGAVFAGEHGNAGAQALVFDFAKLDYISSAGLRVLLAAHKQMSRKGGMTVKNVNEIVQEVFEVTGFSDILNIE